MSHIDEMVWCECGMEAVSVWHDPNGVYIELAFWQVGSMPPGLRQRLRGAVAWLRGQPFADMVVMTPTQAQRLSDILRRTET